MHAKDRFTADSTAFNQSGGTTYNVATIGVGNSNGGYCEIWTQEIDAGYPQGIWQNRVLYHAMKGNGLSLGGTITSLYNSSTSHSWSSPGCSMASSISGTDARLAMQWNNMDGVVNVRCVFASGTVNLG